MLPDVWEVTRSAASSSSIGTSAAPRAYIIQPEDVGDKRLNVSCRLGVLVSEMGEAALPKISQDLGQSFRSCITRGDGACGLHAMWGVPSIDGGLAIPGGQEVARTHVADMLPQQLAELQELLGRSQHL